MLADVGLHSQRNGYAARRRPTRAARGMPRSTDARSTTRAPCPRREPVTGEALSAVRLRTSLARWPNRGGRTPGSAGPSGLGCSMNGDVPPGGGPEPDAVVVGGAGQRQAVLGHGVPLLARHLAGLAADAERGVGEETLARGRLDPAGVGPPGRSAPRRSCSSRPEPARARRGPEVAGGRGDAGALPVLHDVPGSAGPRGRRPG